MKKLIPLFTIFLIISFFGMNAEAQVTVAGSGGAANGSYLTLKDAFDALNLVAVQAGNVITVSITGNTAETAPAVLNQPATSSWTSLKISPSGGTWTITGAIAAGNPLMDLNGADNVLVDGLNSGGNSLTISNTTASATAGTSTVKFRADATNNTITRCSLLGSSNMAVTVDGGTVWFSLAGASTGNDNNTISSCIIGPAGANFPTRGVYAVGTTTASLNNSNVTITGNNISDYFSPTVTSSGIQIAAGNTDWIISNNKLFQTTTITQTTSSLHTGITINNTSGNNFQVNGNTVGFGSAAGTGTYTLTGVSNTFRGINLAVGTTTASSVQGNTITAINQTTAGSGTSTSSPSMLLYISSGVVNAGDISGNNLGSLNGATSVVFSLSSASAIDVYAIYNFASSTAIVSNNNIGNITMSNSAAGAVVFYGIRLGLLSTLTGTASGNTIGSVAGPLTNTSVSVSSRVIGIGLDQSFAPTGILTNNTISNLTMSAANVGTGSSASVIGINYINTTPSAGNNISQNTIHSLSNTNAIAPVWVVGLSYSGNTTTGTHLVSRNFIHSLSVSSTSATATINGINIVGGLTTYQNNMIRLGLDAAGTSLFANGCSINGISEIAAGTDNIYFNSVYIGGTGVGGSANTFAFQSSITTNTRNYRDNIFYNARSNGAGTGKHYAVRVGGTAPNPAGLTINNNVYLANGTGGVFGLFNGADVSTLGAWQTAVGQDVNSFSSDPQFITPNGTAATVNLHISPSIPSIVESNGFNIAAITDDFDGQLRSGLTPVDIGADAGNFISSGDISPPAISYSLLLNTSSTTNRSFTPVTITDISGVNGAPGTRPRVYYKRKTDPNVFNNNLPGTLGWKFAEASGATSPFSFTINYSLLSGGGGVVGGDSVQYFVVAQDLAAPPNVGINSGTFAVQPASVALTAAAFPIGGAINGYLIVGSPLSGDYTVGLLNFNRAAGKNISFEKVVKKVMKEVPVIETKTKYNNEKDSYETDGESLVFNSEAKKEMKEVEEVTYVPMENGAVYDGALYVKRSEDPNLPEDALLGIYATLTAAVTDLNLRGSSGPVRFLLNDATYPSETFPIIVGNATASAVNTLTIQPNTGVTPVISGSSTTGILVFGCPYCTLNGDNVGGGSGRDLTINNTSSASLSYVVGFFNTGSPYIASNCTVKNSKVQAGGLSGSSNTTWGVLLNAAGGDFDNAVIDNNEITQASVGIQFAGVSGFTSDNGQISNNVFGSSTNALSIFLKGVLVSFTDNLLIVNNNIGGQETGNTTLAADATVGNSGICIINSSTNTKIRKNLIHDFYYNGTGGYGAFGIVYGNGAATNTGTTEISNNMIYNIKGDGDDSATVPTSMGYLPQGICIFNNGTSGIQIYYNSIYMSGATLGSTFVGSSSCIGIANTVGANSLNIRNNALRNSMTPSGVLSGRTFSVWVSGASSVNTIFNDINYNDYYTNGYLPAVGWFNTAQVTLADWKTTTAKDVNSIAADPLFTSTTNLHINTGGPPSPVDAAATPIGGITNDIDGDARNGSTPDIGADEFSSNKILTLTLRLEAIQLTRKDTITVSLRSSIAPFPIVETKKVLSDTTWTTAIPFSLAQNGTSYYLYISHRNSITTWSAAPVLCSGDVMNYDFTTSLSQAYASNQTINALFGPLPSFISGDVSSIDSSKRDSVINLADIIKVFNASSVFLVGPYLVTDLNYSGNVNLTDIVTVFNNSTKFYKQQNPPGAAPGPVNNTNQDIISNGSNENNKAMIRTQQKK